MKLSTICLIIVVVHALVLSLFCTLYETRLNRICRRICKYPSGYKSEIFTYKGKEFHVKVKAFHGDFSDYYTKFSVYVNDKLCITIESLDDYTSRCKFIYKVNKVNEEQLIKILKECKKAHYKKFCEDFEKEHKSEDLY